MTKEELRKEIRRLKDQERVDEDQILSALKRRLAIVTTAQLSEKDPNKRKANNEEIKELSNAIEKFERSVASRKSFWTWILQFALTGIASVIVVLVSIFAPWASNKMADKGLGLLRRLKK